MTAVNWEIFRKCPVCFAHVGKPCVSVSGTDGTLVATDQVRDRPHTRRHLRTGYTRTGDHRG